MLLNKKRSMTLFEILVVIMIITIMTGGILAMTHSFSQRQSLDISATSLLRDLRQTQQFARVQKDGYKYYGLCFFAGIGVDDNNDGTKDRQGWKIVRFEPPAGVSPDEMDPTQAGHLYFARYTVIKGSEAADNPEFLENTYFAKGVILNASREFQVSRVFTPEGSVTSDGLTLLENSEDDIILSGFGHTKTIHIIPLTGHIKIEE